MSTLKRYEYWASDNGKPSKKFTSWFLHKGEKEKWQEKNKLLNEYKDENI